MPHITVRGIREERLRELSRGLKEAFVAATETKEEYVKIFYSPVRRVDAEDETAADVYWMPRPQELCDRAAKAITDYFKAHGETFVQVTFTEFPGCHFYEDGVHD